MCSGDCWWLFGGVPISLITNVKFDGPYMIRCVHTGPWIIPIKVSPAAGHFCPDGGHQIYPNLSGFSDRPLDFREICPDNWIGLQNPAKNHQKSPKKSPVRNSLDPGAVE